MLLVIALSFPRQLHSPLSFPVLHLVILVLLFGGDFGQLPPVLDKPLQAGSMGHQTPRIGHLAFNALDTYLLLDQPERRAHIRLCSTRSQTFALVSQRHKMRPSGGPAVHII
jgi:hypothetical protein